MNIYLSPEAEADFVGVVGYLAERNPTAATELGRRIFAVIDKLARREFDGPEQTLRNGDLVRSWPVPPIRIYYQRRTDALWIVRLYHQAQPPIVR
ncbi:MAG TPA: type II toxin-antitoxin system RelE/ParE family toxin [Kofleriaceae bacterium]